MEFSHWTTRILRIRLLVDLVPLEYRNSIYSFIPAITTLFSVPLLPVAGQIIDSFSLVACMVVVLTVFITGFLLITLGIRLMKSDAKIIPLDGSITIEKPEKSEAVG